MYPSYNFVKCTVSESFDIKEKNVWENGKNLIFSSILSKLILVWFFSNVKLKNFSNNLTIFQSVIFLWKEVIWTNFNSPILWTFIVFHSTKIPHLFISVAEGYLTYLKVICFILLRSWSCSFNFNQFVPNFSLYSNQNAFAYFCIFRLWSIVYLRHRL